MAEIAASSTTIGPDYIALQFDNLTLNDTTTEINCSGYDYAYAQVTGLASGSADVRWKGSIQVSDFDLFVAAVENVVNPGVNRMGWIYRLPRAIQMAQATTGTVSVAVYLKKNEK